VSGRYAPFAGLLRRDGFRVAGHRGRFTAASLQGARILVIANALGDDGPWELPARPAFTAEEVATLVRWVEGGGSLMLVADHMPFPGSAHALGQALGVEWTDGFAMFSAQDRGIFVLRRGDGLQGDTPVTSGRSAAARVDSIKVFTGSAFRLAPGASGRPVLVHGPGIRDFQPQTAWVFLPGTPAPDAAGTLVGAILERGAGRVAVFGEAAMFSAQLAGAAQATMGFNDQGAAQNAQFALNTLHWLAGLLEPR
jgi:hypothetical protein